jgi:hypothetical protein
VTEGYHRNLLFRPGEPSRLRYTESIHPITD